MIDNAPLALSTIIRNKITSQHEESFESRFGAYTDYAIS